MAAITKHTAEVEGSPVSSVNKFALQDLEKHNTNTRDTGKEQISTTLSLPPEEGVKGWLCVIGSFLTLFGSFGFLNACVSSALVIETRTDREKSWRFSELLPSELLI